MRPILIAALALTPLPATADDITDALNAAISAYEAGDVGDALGEIAYVTQLLNALQAEGFTAFLPPALDGWTRTESDDISATLGFMGGGTAAEATYSGPGSSFTITMMADNPMVASMAAILGNPAIMGTMGRIERIGGEMFLDADGSLATLIGGRILIQAEGGDVTEMAAHLEQIDFNALVSFGQ